MSDNSIKTNLEWTSSLDIDYQPINARKTSIICTIGIVADPRHTFAAGGKDYGSMIPTTVQSIEGSFYFLSIQMYLGPKTNSVEMISKLRDAGMNIVRMVSAALRHILAKAGRSSWTKGALANSRLPVAGEKALPEKT